MAGIMQEWTQIIGMRHQGVLVSAMRGCDLAPRHDPSKFAQRLLRRRLHRRTRQRLFPDPRLLRPCAAQCEA